MPIRIQASSDGPKLTVSGALANPRFIPERTLRTLENQFLVDGLFRAGPPATGGVVGYMENQPRFATDDPEVVEEYGEIPVIMTGAGAQRAARTIKRAAALVVSREMRDRNDTGRLNDRITMVRNTFTRYYDREFMGVLLGHPDVPRQAVEVAWTAETGTRIRRDLATAAQTIENATVPDLGADHLFGYEADTVVIPTTVGWAWINSDEINEIFKGGQLADQDLRYTGVLPKKFFGLNVVRARALNGTNRAIVMQRDMAGFISDERGMEATPMYEEKKTETWRCDFTRRSVAKLDNPRAVVVLEGVEA